jgi:hypothetical protein
MSNQAIDDQAAGATAAGARANNKLTLDELKSLFL